MSKSKLLILDTNVIIHLHELGIWKKLINVCEVHLAQTIVEETAFYDDDDTRHYIDLTADIASGSIEVFEVALAELRLFQERFDSLYISELDPGELEALAYLCGSKQEFLISSGDAIVYRVLGRLNKGEQGISLEELLAKVGIQQSQIAWPYRRQFREKHTRVGFTDSLSGAGLRK